MTAPHRTPSSSFEPLPPETQRTLARLHARAWGVATGFLMGFGLFFATIILVLQGGPDMGQHLGLISVFLPGYSVSVVGAFVGFVYAFVIGYAFGRIVGTVYNATVRPQ
ncbi:MAG: hypothetical protein IPP90_01175 [Gemmatimonadaceae bacterium]|nr:hypothetical protein [Gemmatimonadaceae bacterium]